MHTYRIVSKRHFLSLFITALYLSSGKMVKCSFHRDPSHSSEPGTHTGSQNSSRNQRGDLRPILARLPLYRQAQPGPK